MAIHKQQQLDKTFHALGDATRRKILATLATTSEAVSAGQLQKPFNVAQPTISKHLKVLEKAGLVKRHISGRTHNFSLVPKPMNDAVDWIERHSAFWEGTLGSLEKHLNDNDLSEDQK